MATTMMLAQVIGIFMLVMGLSILLRQELYRTAIAEFPEQPLLRIVVAAFELIAGLFMVMLHNVWSPLPAALITAFGYILVVEAVFYLTASNRLIRTLVRAFDHRIAYSASSLFCAAIGAYLTCYGFGWIAG